MQRVTPAGIYGFAADSYVTMTAESPHAATDGTRPKSTLICPTCGHESTPAGDWLTRERKTHSRAKLALICPTCKTEITHRPLSEANSREERLVAPSR